MYSIVLSRYKDHKMLLCSIVCLPSVLVVQYCTVLYCSLDYKQLLYAIQFVCLQYYYYSMKFVQYVLYCSLDQIYYCYAVQYVCLQYYQYSTILQSRLYNTTMQYSVYAFNTNSAVLYSTILQSRLYNVTMQYLQFIP